MTGFRDKIELTHEVHDSAAALFTAWVVDRGLKQSRFASWATAARSLEPLGEPLHRRSGSGHDSAVLERDGTLLYAGLMGGWIHVQAAAPALDRVEATMTELRRLFPPPDPSSTHRVGVQFWTYGQHGPIPSYREISVPEWSDLEQNYTAPVRSTLDRLMRGFQPAHGGQLILWHGEVGTGKTFALRALAWEWRDWCEFHYIVDPDSFFGEHADYLMGVLTQPGYADMPDPRLMRYATVPGVYAAFGEGSSEEDGEGSKAWRLLVLEDTGELLTPDAKSIIGQGLSRFLNVVDGLIGQGLRVLVLVTTNEPIRGLHPAVARPGRCAANIEFEPLSTDEAAAWLAHHDFRERVERPIAIAELYAKLEGRSVDSMPPTGFAG